MTHPSLSTWEEAARPADKAEAQRGVLTHRRGPGLSFSSPLDRILELNYEVNRLRGYLGEAGAEVRRLQTHYDRWHGMRDTSFAGITMAQTWDDLILWEAILNTASEYGLAGIMEIGTWKGGLSGWLWAQAQIRDLKFVTYDASVPELPEALSDSFRRVDVFSKQGKKAVGEWIAWCEKTGPMILFCDGGNKPRELKELTPMLKHPSSLVVVHDWGTETNPEDVPEWLEEMWGAHCDEVGSMSRVFKVKP